MFETDEHNQYFLATIKIHEAFIDEDAYLKKIGKEKDEETENVPSDMTNVGSDVGKENSKELTERQCAIIELIKGNPAFSAREMSEKMSEKKSVSARTIERELETLQKQGAICREGGRKNGHWVVNK